MKDEDILVGKPEGSTHVETLASTKAYYLRKDKNTIGYAVFISNEWTKSMVVAGYIRSLADIKTIVELKKQVAELENYINIALDNSKEQLIDKIAELEKEGDWLLDFALHYTDMDFINESFKQLREGVK